MELSMSSRPVKRWMFGKLPALGDFVSRGLDHAMRDALDRWLSAGLEAAQAHFAGDFEARYGAAPAWCFIDRDAEGGWSGGAMCASIDAAGRRFPLLMGAPAEDAGEAVGLAGACRDVLYRALAEQWDASRMVECELTALDLGWASDGPAWALVGDEGPPVVVAGRFPENVVPLMLECAA